MGRKITKLKQGGDVDECIYASTNHSWASRKINKEAIKIVFIRC